MCAAAASTTHELRAALLCTRVLYCTVLTVVNNCYCSLLNDERGTRFACEGWFCVMRCVQ
jgi:hypothetical protein